MVCLDGERQIEYAKEKAEGLRTVWRERRGKEVELVEQRNKEE